MKKLMILLSSTIIILTSCGQQDNSQTQGSFSYQENGAYAESVSYTDNAVSTTNNRNSNQANKSGYKYYYQKSQDFQIPVGAMLIPTSWEESTNTAEGLLFEGPQGIKIYKSYSTSFYYSNDYQMNQIMQQNGSTVAPPKGIERVIQEDIGPYVQTLGLHYKRQYPAPQIAQFDTRFDSYLFKSTPEQKQYQCLVTEWEDKQGNPAMIIVRYHEAMYQIGGMDWGYTVNLLKANRNAYPTAKNDLINAIVNYEINPQWVDANNQYWAQVAQQQNAGHQQRMAAIKAQGNAILEAGRQNSRMMDQNHQQFMNNLRSDNGHSQFIDYIRDETNVTDYSTGNTYKVDAGSDYYWMNNNGEYISSDDPNYNPNADPNYYNQNWNQAEIRK